MIDDLLELMKNKNFAEVILADEGSVQGFITYVGADRFHIITMEPVAPLLTPENHIVDEFGNIHIAQNEEDINLLPVKHSYDIGMIVGIIFDITHRLQPEFVKTIFFLRDNTIYSTEPKKKSPRNRHKTKSKTPIIKE